MFSGGGTIATILIVDDVRANRTFLVTLLASHGHRLLEAADGREGLAAVHAEPPDLILTDVLMPIMDGYEFVRRLSITPATRGIPVVFCTAHYGAREARALALSSGVAAVLSKPLDSGEVRRVVDRLLAAAPVRVAPPYAAPLATDFDRQHLRLLTDKLSEKVEHLETANARLCALFSIGWEFASERDSDRLLRSVGLAARDLFKVASVTLGLLHHENRVVHHVVTCGADPGPAIHAGDSLAGTLATVVAERCPMRGDRPGEPSATTRSPVRHAFLTVPIASPTHVYGWIDLLGHEGQVLGGDDEALVLALGGQIGRIYELDQEIVDRHEAELAVRRERDRAQRYLDTAEVILLGLDLDGRITLINRNGCTLMGWTEQELIGRDWAETCLPPRIRETFRATFRRMVGGDHSIHENPVLTKSGEERVVEWGNTLLRDEDGCIIGTFSSGTDITDRHRATTALRIAEERMRFVLESAGVGIWDMDFSTGQLQCSPTLESQYGVSPGAMGGTLEALLERVHPQDRDALRDTMATAHLAGADFSAAHRTLRPDGTVRWLSGAGRIHRDAQGAPVRGVGISLDVTDRRELEAQYQQAQKMEAIGQLAGGVAHDFNNLLTVILGFCELLLETPDPDAQRQADITEIQKAGTRAAALTRQLLTVSRRAIIEPTRLDLNEVVGDMQGMLRRLIRADIIVVRNLSPARAWSWPIAAMSNRF